MALNRRVQNYDTDYWVTVEPRLPDPHHDPDKPLSLRIRRDDSRERGVKFEVISVFLSDEDTAAIVQAMLFPEGG